MNETVSAINFTAIILVVVFFAILLVVIGIIGFLYYTHRKRKKREERSLDSVLLEVAVQRNNEIKPDAMEQFVTSLYSMKESGWKVRTYGQPVVSFEIVARAEDIRFYIWTFAPFRDLIEKQLHGSYPDADIREVSEYNVFTPDGKVAYKAFQLSKELFYPLKTYSELPVDPLAAMTSALAKMQAGEAAIIQVLLSPIDAAWQKQGRDYIASTKKQESDPEKAKYVPTKSLEAIESKVSKPGFETSLRVVVVSHNIDMAKNHLSNIVGAFSQFNSEHQTLGSRNIMSKGGFIENVIYRMHPLSYFWKVKMNILNAAEIATIFHFPNKLITTPHIHWLNAKSAPAPAEVPMEGLHLGKSRFRGVDRDVFISEKDRLRHMYIIGKTGTGKSEFLKHLIRQDINEGKGLCFIDPHGDAVEDLLNYIPAHRAEDVIYFRPSDAERPFGINLLSAKTEDQKHFVTNVIINMMYKLFDPYKTGIVGPRFEHTVRNAMLTVMSEEGTTFVELMRALQDPNYVKELLPKVQDPIVRRFWTDQIAQTSDFHKSETLDYITSKFGRFVTNKMVRNIIGQSESSFDFRRVMDEGKILLVNLSKGELGEENSSFLGLLLVPRILMAAMSRSDIPEEQRRDFYLYVDEFQNFATPDFAQILSEARKYKLALTVANQFIGQIDEEIKNAIFGNVGTVMSYRVGVADAGYLAHEFTPTFTEEDLLNIERYHVYVKTIVNNEPIPPFSMKIDLNMDEIKASANPKVAEVVREMSRVKYGRDVRLVEAEITRRAKL